MSQEVINISELKARLENFANEREWRKFHSPKNLAMATSVEAAELTEIFQWVTEEESWKMGESDKKEAIEDEVADIMLYLVRLSSLLDIDVANAIDRKFQKNIDKYPSEKFKGSARKYNESED